MKIRLILFSIAILVSCKNETRKAEKVVKSIDELQNTQTINTGFLEEVPNWMDENDVPAVGIGLIENGEIKSINVLGELKDSIPAPKNTIFNIASVTKTIGTMLTLELIESGEWDLDAPLYNYWVDPDIENDPRHKELTTRHVLTHTTGFPNWRDDSPDGKLAFKHDPGTVYGYSGEGFQYLRNSIEKKFDRPIQTLSDSLIFKPLNMEDTWHKWNENVHESRYARWHNGKGELYEGDHKIYWPSLDDDLLTTIEDYCKFGLYVIEKANQSLFPYDLMSKPQFRVKKDKAIGLGWGLITKLPNQEYALHHGGGDYGVKTEVILLPKSKMGVVVFTNGDNGDYVIREVINQALKNDSIWDYMYSRDDLPPIANVHKSKLASYAGIYINPDGIEIKITPQENSLILTGARFPKTIVYPESDTKFFVKMYDQGLEFLTNDSGTATEMVIYGNGEKWQSAKKLD